MGGMIRNLKGKALLLNGMVDHVQKKHNIQYDDDFIWE
jgi:hypothetical protein